MAQLTPEETIKIFERVWALPEDRAKLALFGLIMVHESGGKLSLKFLEPEVKEEKEPG